MVSMPSERACSRVPIERVVSGVDCGLPEDTVCDESCMGGLRVTSLTKTVSCLAIVVKTKARA